MQTALPFQRDEHPLDPEGKADGRAVDSKFAVQPVIPSAGKQGKSHFVGHAPEHNAGIVMVFMQHPQIQGQIFFIAKFAEQLVDRLQIIQSCGAGRIARKRPGLLQNLPAAEQPWQGQQLFPKRAVYSQLIQPVFQLYGIFVVDQLPQLLRRLLRDISILQ